MQIPGANLLFKNTADIVRVKGTNGVVTYIKTETGLKGNLQPTKDPINMDMQGGFGATHNWYGELPSGDIREGDKLEVDGHRYDVGRVSRLEFAGIGLLDLELRR